MEREGRSGDERWAAGLRESVRDFREAVTQSRASAWIACQLHTSRFPACHVATLRQVRAHYSTVRRNSTSTLEPRPCLVF